MFEEQISTKEVIEMYISLKPDSVVSQLTKVIGIGSVTAILESNNFKNKLLYLPRTTSLMRLVKPFIIRKRLNGLEGKEREETIQQLSNLFSTSKRVILKMERTGKYYRQ